MVKIDQDTDFNEKSAAIDSFDFQTQSPINIPYDCCVFKSLCRLSRFNLSHYCTHTYNRNFAYTSKIYQELIMPKNLGRGHIALINDRTARTI